MKYLSVLAILATYVFIPQHAHANSAEGYWLTENKRSVIHIEKCYDSLCGNIHWIIEGGMQYDEKNPDPSARKTPMCDLKLLWGFIPDGNNWKDGKIYKADDGDVYNAKITILDENTLKLRGYVGIPLFGKTQKWKRVSPDDYTKCAMPK